MTEGNGKKRAGSIPALEEVGEILEAVDLARALGRPVVEKHYTVQDVASLLSIHPDNVYKMIKDGEMRAVKFGPRRTRIPESSLRAWMEERTADYDTA
jgi:excisionase family DNA binding protein